MSVQDIESAIVDLDKWFQFAESIGQQRLNNFFMAASILLAALATVYPFNKFLAGILSLAGIVFSFMWTVIGFRQSKFHAKIDYEQDVFFDKYRQQSKNPDKFAAFHIRTMKYSKDKLAELNLNFNEAHQLNEIERIFSTRTFLINLPFLFYLVFIIFLITVALNSRAATPESTMLAVLPSLLLFPLIILGIIYSKSFTALLFLEICIFLSFILANLVWNK